MAFHVPYKAGLSAFLITAIVTSLILGGQFFYLYSPEILGKGLHFTIYFRLLFYFVMSLVSVTLLVSILAMGIFAGRAYYRSVTNQRNFLRNIAIIAAAISVLGFWLNSVVITWSSYKAFSYLYYMRGAHNEAEFLEMWNDENKTNRLFYVIRQSSSAGIFLLTEQVDEISTKAIDRKKKMILAIEQVGDQQAVRTVLDTSTVAKRCGLSIKDFNISERSVPGKNAAENVKALIDVYALDCQIDSENLDKYQRGIAKQMFFPVILFLMVFSGLLLGYVFRRVNLFGLIAVFFFVFAVIPVLLDRLVDYVVKEKIAGPFTANLVYALLLIVPLVLLLRVDKKVRSNRE